MPLRIQAREVRIRGISKMIFQSLDDKKECVGAYANGQLYYDNFPKDLLKTWAFSPYFYNKDVEYAQIYCKGKSLHEVCPADLMESYESVSKKMKAFIKSFSTSKISLEENCFFDLVPKRFLMEFCEIKNKISQSVFEEYSKPLNHDFMVKINQMTFDISCQYFKLDKSFLNSRLAESRVLNFRNKINSYMRVNYNLFGTVTGRLTTHRDSFPILTLDKGFRGVVGSSKGILVELDFNAAELRTLLGLSGVAQPQEDLHMWNVKNIYNNSITREEAKEKIFSWLYNPKSIDIEAERCYNRQDLVNKYYYESCVGTPMGRVIETDKRRALNYLVQSTSSDIFLNSAYEVWKMLQNRNSEIRFLVHDSVLLDVSNEDRHLLSDIVDKFSKTPLGTYKVGVSIGNNYGEMRKIK